MAFTGFTTDKLVGLPPELFSEVLPQITLASELKITLHVFYRMSRQRGPAPRRVSWDELADDKTLRRSLRSVSKLRPPEELLAEGLDAAVRRTTLLHVVLPDNGRAVNWYVVNTAANQLWAERIGLAGTTLAPNGALPDERPALITLYEQNIGLITPLLVDELREVVDVAGHRVAAVRRPLAVAMPPQVGRDDVPVLPERLRRPVPAAAVIPATMDQEERRLLRMAPVHVVKAQALGEVRV